MGTPFVRGLDGECLDAAYFHACNRGKRSIVADFATDEGLDVVRALVLLAPLARSEVLAALESRGIPAGPINTVAEVFADAQVRHRGLVCHLAAPSAEIGNVPSIRTPMVFSGSRLELERAAPLLGQHNEEIRRELGFPQV